MPNSPTFEKAIEEAQADSPDLEKMLALLNESQKEGDARAAYTLGSWYLQGQNVEQNPEKAIPLLNQAAEEGVLEALFDLAVCYEQGIGVELNERQAFEHYLRAALGGDPEALHEVGRCYYYGIGVGEDKALAEIWLDHADGEEMEDGFSEDDED
ncbi:MAG: sel1 repeat family protein [Nitrospina sp.]|nr:sel1 repeat family protein [Nitrospina sp.]